MASSLHANQTLSLPLNQSEAAAFSPSFKTRTIFGSLVFGCSLGPFRRRKNQNPVLKKKACTATASGECAPDAKRAFIVHTETDIQDVSGSSPTPSADRVAHAPASLPLQPCSGPPASHDCTTSQSSAAAVKTYAKRNSVILSDSSEDEGCSSSVPAVKEAAGMDGVERGQDEDDVDLLDPWLSSSESCDERLSGDDDFINDESSSSCSSPGCSPVLRERVPIILQTKKKQRPCHRCRKRDGDRFRCSECQHTFHEDCGGPGPSCTLCSGCAAALGVDPTQLSSSSSDDSLSSSSDSGDGSSASSSGSSNAEYECAVCQENDCGYIRACRVCGVRAHESCGGPGPMHRKCDKYDACPLSAAFSLHRFSSITTHFVFTSRTARLSCMQKRNQKLPKRGSSRVLELGSNSSSDCSPADDDAGSSDEASDSDVCEECGETDGDIRICKGCNRFLHEICGGPGPCHKLCDACAVALGKPQGRKGQRGMTEL